MQTSRAWHPRPCPSRASSWEDGPHPLHHHGANRPRDGGRGGCRCRRTGRLTAAFPTAEDESPGPRGSQGATTSLQPHHGCQLALEAGAAVPGGVSWSLGPAPPAAAQAGDRPAWPPGTTASGFKAFASARRRRPSLPPDPVGPPTALYRPWGSRVPVALVTQSRQTGRFLPASGAAPPFPACHRRRNGEVWERQAARRARTPSLGARAQAAAPGKASEASGKSRGSDGRDGIPALLQSLRASRDGSGSEGPSPQERLGAHVFPAASS